MNNSFFAGVEDVNKQVDAGEISGFVEWPLEGTALVDEIKTDYKKGAPYFFIKLVHPAKGAREFAVKVPQQQDKDSAKFMAMQKIYATVYAIGGATPGRTSVQEAFNKASSSVGREMNYKLEEYESFSEKHGKYFTNQSLAALSEAAVQGEGEFA